MLDASWYARTLPDTVAQGNAAIGADDGATPATAERLIAHFARQGARSDLVKASSVHAPSSHDNCLVFAAAG